MSFTRWFVYASFASGVIALSLQPSGMANATSSPIVLVADQSSSSGQDVQRDRSKKGTANAESSGKMQSERDALPGDGNMNPSSRSDGRSSRGQGSEVAPGSPNPGAPGNSSPSSGNSSMGGGSGTSGAGTGGGSR